MVNTLPGMVFSIRIHFVLHNPVWTDSYELRSSWAVFLNIPSHKIEISTCQFRLPTDKFTKFRLEHAFINNVLNLRHVHRPAVAPRLTQHVKVRTKVGYHIGLHKIQAYDIHWLTLIVLLWQWREVSCRTGRPGKVVKNIMRRQPNEILISWCNYGVFEVPFSKTDSSGLKHV